MSNARQITGRAASRTFWWLVLICFCTVASGFAQVAPRPEYEIKAAFLYKFTLFVEWPPNVRPEENRPIVIGVAGKNSFGDTLDSFVKNRTAHNRQIAVRYLNSPSEISGCHLLFICPSESQLLDDYLAAARDSAVLTVGDTPGMAARGVMINLIQRNKGLGFEINRGALERAGLKASSQLLDLAQIIKTTP